MPKPHDSTTKRLVETRPADWLSLLELPLGPTALVDTDLSTIVAEADRMVQVESETPYLFHAEFETGHHAHTAPTRLARYNIVADYKFGMPVVSVVFLLRQSANSPSLTGIWERFGPDGTVHLTFRYRVVRVWELPVETVLAGGLTTLPLAPITRLAATDLPGIVRQMESRIESEATPEQAGELWTATYTLMGLRFPPEFSSQLLRGVRQMKESSTYQAILEEGREKGEAQGLITGALREARQLLLRLGRKRLGTPSAEVETRIAAIESRDRLEMLHDRVLDVESWDDLLTEE